MFTGIVQAVGRVESAEKGRLVVLAPDAWPGDPWQVGESVAVDGCCLTVTEASAGLRFDLSGETLERTTLGSLKAGDKVNLERALRASDRLGGHIVQGHVDATGSLVSRNGTFTFRVDEDWSKLLIDKGSVALNGVSLTVVQPKGGQFSVAMIPHTLESTTMGSLQPGSAVNVEFDVLAKYALNLR
ncbi:MAG TPA: riboflavin synthase [Fimbriimonadaceae bacterium]|nr:riboflavin synthase [Fimbriimonadaceae bacterium]